MLFEAGVHYYKATGKTRLLEASVKLANYMCNYMGIAPKQNIVPAHSGPEEAVLKLYWLFKSEPQLKTKLNTPVNEEQYYDLAQFWVKGRGVHCGMPDWYVMGNNNAEKWIRDEKYNNPSYGNHSRPSFGAYAQDDVPLSEQKTIEGHAVRATLFLTGASSLVVENNDPVYFNKVTELWDNMAGKRMFITGGVGAIASDEKFGPDYYLPNDAYLETCAAVGAGFFSQRMNQLTGNGKYMDAYERILYNSLLTSVSYSGTEYTYQNHLNSDHHTRWDWHGCPCCPPMFLKMISAFPGLIYSYSQNTIFVNLFVGSEAKINMGNQQVIIKQTTNYPWKGNTTIQLMPESDIELTLKIRIPGWATKKENPFDLYRSDLKSSWSITINGKEYNTLPVDGYVAITRKWKKEDVVNLDLPMKPRFIYAHELANELKGLVAIQSGPIVYCLEDNSNLNLNQYIINVNAETSLEYHDDLLGGIGIISGNGNVDSMKQDFHAIPYYALGNLKPGNAYKVWIPYR